MCGIAGLATRDGLRQGDTQLVDRMLASLAHRGPDEQYAMADEQTVVGSRRLSIIDLETGRQPLTNEDGTVIVSQNGEIYGYIELRERLLQEGHVFRTNGDTETIAHAYEAFGPSFVDHLHGMFAIALWDTSRRRLVLARDRLGKKPLYWRLHGGRLTWGSELKAIVADASVDRQVDREGLALFLNYGYVPAPTTILAGVHKLPPASVLTWEGGTPSIERYWSPPYLPKTQRPIEEDREILLDLLRTSTRLRLRSDVPVGAFLSGGLDSSTVVALMAEASAQPIRTFSIGFEEAGFDELPHARAVAEAFGTQHTEEIVRIDAIRLLPDLATAYDEPFADSSAIPTFRVAQLAAQELKVVLTGDGGDESFGGYNRYRKHALTNLPGGVVGGLGRAAATMVAHTVPSTTLGRKAATWRHLVDQDPDTRYLHFVSQFERSTRRALLGEDGPLLDDRFMLDRLAGGPPRGADRLLRADLLSYLPEDLLVKMDRATMANSLEARSPLLDHRLVEFAAALPVDRKIQGQKTKVLLRDVAGGLLPESILRRPKMGFSVPVAEWFLGDLGTRFEELALAPDSAIRGIVDQEEVRRLFREHRTGVAGHGSQLWALTMLEMWGRTWLGSSARMAA
jgi:asparagine synthase (glutamine-hydrolysing)